MTTKATFELRPGPTADENDKPHTVKVQYPNWLKYPHLHKAHVIHAGHRAATQRLNETAYKVQKAMRDCRAGKKPFYKPSRNIIIENFKTPYGTSCVLVKLHGGEIVRWMPDIPGERSPRFFVTLAGWNTTTTRRYVNLICYAFGVAFYCWTHRDQLWAMWNSPMDAPGVLTIGPIDPSDDISAAYCPRDT